MQLLDPAGAAMIPPPTQIRPELEQDDVDWLNHHLQLTDRPPFRYARELPAPPPPPSGVRPPPVTGWITCTTVRG